MKKVALVLPGGGARSSYQAGVLLGLNDLLVTSLGRPLQLQIICGISGGAINSAYLASRADQLPIGIRELWESWNSIRMSDIFDASGTRILAIAARMVAQLGAGGMYQSSSANQILDTTPLAMYLKNKIDFRKI